MARKESHTAMDELTLVIEGGADKQGREEPLGHLELHAGEVVALVGPTGSGKTRLLADIERLSRGDSPTGRRVTLQGGPGDRSEAMALVARISQSMGFILDATAADFLRMHAEFRGHGDPASAVDEALVWANRICGESFDAETPLAHLSGGQARALMIADTVIISNCPVLLIDEIENAGIDRTAALDFLLSHQSIALVATHDPLIALRAEKRIVMAQGAMTSLVERTDSELGLLDQLTDQWEQTEKLQAQLRKGLTLDTLE